MSGREDRVADSLREIRAMADLVVRASGAQVSRLALAHRIRERLRRSDPMSATELTNSELLAETWWRKDWPRTCDRCRGVGLIGGHGDLRTCHECKGTGLPASEGDDA